MTPAPFKPHERRQTPAQGTPRRNGRSFNIYFDEPLYKAIVAEAKRRGWPFARMVRFLCDASIEGIE